MKLTERYVGILTLGMLSRTPKMNEAKECALEALNALAQRDLEWVKFLKETYNIEIDYEKILTEYRQAENSIKKY